MEREKNSAVSFGSKFDGLSYQLRVSYHSIWYLGRPSASNTLKYNPTLQKSNCMLEKRIVTNITENHVYQCNLDSLCMDPLWVGRWLVGERINQWNMTRNMRLYISYSKFVVTNQRIIC